MASSTNIKFQAELEALLADNTAKEISAADVRTIVTSNYQPQMVWSGLVSKITSGSNSGEWLCRTFYYNPSYFNSAFGGFVINNAGAGLLTNHTYTDVTLTPPTSYGGETLTGVNATVAATFDVITSATGIVSSVVLKTPGAGWVGSSRFASGMVGTFNIAGASVAPTLTFNGPVYIPQSTTEPINNPQNSGDKYVIKFRNNTAYPNFSRVNTLVNNARAQQPTSGDPENNTGAYLINYSTLYLVTDQQDMSITLWRVAQ
jgi:hypothetical protein